MAQRRAERRWRANVFVTELPIGRPIGYLTLPSRSPHQWRGELGGPALSNVLQGRVSSDIRDAGSAAAPASPELAELMGHVAAGIGAAETVLLLEDLELINDLRQALSDALVEVDPSKDEGGAAAADGCLAERTPGLLPAVAGAGGPRLAVGACDADALAAVASALGTLCATLPPPRWGRWPGRAPKPGETETVRLGGAPGEGPAWLGPLREVEHPAPQEQQRPCPPDGPPPAKRSRGLATTRSEAARPRPPGGGPPPKRMRPPPSGRESIAPSAPAGGAELRAEAPAEGEAAEAAEDGLAIANGDEEEAGGQAQLGTEASPGEARVVPPPRGRGQRAAEGFHAPTAKARARKVLVPTAKGQPRPRGTIEKFL
ncbi:unnamed protein product [Prorocentrum cordatum]|uniref:Uncharacterized protein n=1 Tax=Prorocentrum cordatum TaxID=2364126 RepID=A0ABN9VKT7_9DINO|nr:unnamed protein product [Polarella glacialis]